MAWLGGACPEIVPGGPIDMPCPEIDGPTGGACPKALLGYLCPDVGGGGRVCLIG